VSEPRLRDGLPSRGERPRTGPVLGAVATIIYLPVAVQKGPIVFRKG